MWQLQLALKLDQDMTKMCAMSAPPHSRPRTRSDPTKSVCIAVCKEGEVKIKVLIESVRARSTTPPLTSIINLLVSFLPLSLSLLV